MSAQRKPTAVIVAAEFNKPLIDAMIEAATSELSNAGAELGRLIRVPGCYEIPLALNAALSGSETDVAVVLGYIERGETQHGEVMGHVTHAAFVRIALERGKPVGVGIIGPGATPTQAEERKDGYARAAVRAALASLAVIRRLRAD